RFEPPTDRATLAHWYRAADLTVVPSYSESFGLVAIESQACGTPVVAAAVGGLRTSVSDGSSGVLITGHNADEYARVLADLLDNPAHLRQLRTGSRIHAARFGWASTASGLITSYTRAMREFELQVTRVAQ
ncbi:MAG: glycosyltransferase, partial [Actinomycetota bacterium]|nr:glycosyltransferase [Actinomycetota bacterium]